MEHKRSIFAGMTDYTTVSHEDIVKDLKQWSVYTQESIDLLKNLEPDIVSDSPDAREVKEFIQRSIYVFSGFRKELDRLASEIADQIRSSHPKAIYALYESAQREEERCVKFKHLKFSHFDEKLYRTRDEAYAISRDQVVDYYDLSNLRSRLIALEGSGKKENKESNDKSEIWRVIIVLAFTLIMVGSFFILSATKASLLTVFLIVILPLLMAGVTHEKISGKDYAKMYADGLRSIPLIGKAFSKILKNE